MALPGHPKHGGRARGTPNKVTKNLQELADELGVNPFEILLRFASNDWKSLGYESRTTTRYAKDGTSYEVDNIEPDHRIIAAKGACDYLFPKRKAVEMTGAQGKDLFQSFGQIVKAIVDKGNGSSSGTTGH